MPTPHTSSWLNPVVLERLIELFSSPWFASIAVLIFSASMPAVFDAIASPDNPFSFYKTSKRTLAIFASLVGLIVVGAFLFTPLYLPVIIDTSGAAMVLTSSGVGLLLGAFVARRAYVTYHVGAIARLTIASACLTLSLLVVIAFASSVHPIAADVVPAANRPHYLKINNSGVQAWIVPKARDALYDIGDRDRHLPADTDFLVTVRVLGADLKPKPDPGAHRVATPIITQIKRRYLVPRLTGTFMTSSPVIAVPWDTQSPDGPPEWSWYLRPNRSGPQAITLRLIQTDNALFDQGAATGTGEIVLADPKTVFIDEPNLAPLRFQQLLALLTAIATIVSGIASVVAARKKPEATAK